MTERLLSVDAEPTGPNGMRHMRLAGWSDYASTPLYRQKADAISAELDRLYAAAEANQAPGPDWKAKLRERVEASRDEANGDGYRAGLAEALALIDALPDPPTPDPDAPPVYVPPEGHYAPVLGRVVPDGWEGRYINGSGGFDWSAKSCRSTGRDALFEVRRVPAPEPATEWVPLYEALAAERVADSPGVGPFVVARVVRAPDGPVLAMSADGSRYVHVREDGMVEVLAEGER